MALPDKHRIQELTKKESFQFLARSTQRNKSLREVRGKIHEYEHNLLLCEALRRKPSSREQVETWTPKQYCPVVGLGTRTEEVHVGTCQVLAMSSVNCD